jgi:hypothetical protein
VKAAQPLIPKTAEAINGDNLATTHVHANCCRFIFRSVAGGQRELRSALDLFSQTSQSLAGAVPFGFCCGGFSSTAGYVPGNEA